MVYSACNQGTGRAELVVACSQHPAECMCVTQPHSLPPFAGVSAVGVALVASAAKGMAGKLCATPLTAIISTGATVIAYYWPKPYTFPSLIGAGGLMTLGWSYYK